MEIHHRRPIPIGTRRHHALNPEGRLPHGGRPSVRSWPLWSLAVLASFVLAGCEEPLPPPVTGHIPVTPEPEPEPAPDLHVSTHVRGRLGDGAVTDYLFAAGGLIFLTASVENVGDGDAPASTLRLYHSPDDAADTELWSGTVPALAAGESYDHWDEADFTEFAVDETHYWQPIVVNALETPGARAFYKLCVDQVPGEPSNSGGPGRNCDWFIVTTVAETPYWGAPYVNGLQYSGRSWIIDDSDHSMYDYISYSGEQRTFVACSFDSPRAVHAYKARFTDGTTVAVMIDQDFGRARADVLADLYARWIGKLPDWSALRELVIIGDCEGFAYARSDVIGIVHWDFILSFGTVGYVLLHEYAHLAYDEAAVASSRWRAAVASDGRFISYYAHTRKDREDVAESYVAWFAVRCAADLLTPAELDFIRSAIPARLAYFDDLLGGRAGCPRG